MFYWIPTTLDDSDQDRVDNVLRRAPQKLTGGGVGPQVYQLLGKWGGVVDTVQRFNHRQAAEFFINKHARKTPTEASPDAQVRDAAVRALAQGELCRCDTENGCGPECDISATERVRKYLHTHEALNSVALPQVTVRGSGTTVRFTPTLVPVASPSVDDVLDGVVARVRVFETPV